MRNGHIPAERLMNILIDFCLTLNQTKLILNYMHVTKTTLSGETSANTSSLRDSWLQKAALFACSVKIESVIFHESTAGPGKTVTLEKLLTESWCKNKYKRQIHLSKTKNVPHDWRLKLFTHRFSDVRFASHTIIKDSNSVEFRHLDEKVKVYIPEICPRLMPTVEIIFLMLVSSTTDEIGTLWLVFFKIASVRLVMVLHDHVFNIGLKVTVTLFVC